MTLISDKRPGGRPSKFRPDFCVRVVELMAEGRSLDGCAALMGARHPTSLETGDAEFRYSPREGAFC